MKLLLIGGVVLAGFALARKASAGMIPGVPTKPESPRDATPNADLGEDFPNSNLILADPEFYPESNSLHVASWSPFVVPYCNLHDVPAQLALGLIWTESEGFSRAIGDGGAAFGLGQMHRDAVYDMTPCQAYNRKLDLSNPADREWYLSDTNLQLDLMLKYLRHCYDVYAPRHEWYQALICYNYGPTRAQRLLAVNNGAAIPSAVKLYAAKVMDRAHRGKGSIYA